METTKQIKLKDGSIVTVKKLNLQDYATLLKALKKLPKEVGKFIEGKDEKDLKKVDVKSFLGDLPSIIGEAIPEFADILSIASDKEAKFYLEGDLVDAMNVLEGALELNDIQEVVNTVKKLMAWKKPTPSLPQVKKK